MKNIGFKNFRRFLDFDPIEYNNITFFVGRNNSGKSTVVKALLLMNAYLKSGNINVFQFSDTVMEDANILTYDRALNKFAKDNFIVFSHRMGRFDIEVKISAEGQKTTADVHRLMIIDTKMNFEYVINPQNNSISISKTKKKIQEEKLLGTETYINTSLKNEIDILKESLKESNIKKSSKEYITLVDKVQSLEEKRKYFVAKKSKKLIKVAKHFNIGLSTVVEFLNEKGYEIDAKPTAKITEEMWELLLVKHGSKVPSTSEDNVFLQVNEPGAEYGVTPPFSINGNYYNGELKDILNNTIKASEYLYHKFAKENQENDDENSSKEDPVFSQQWIRQFENYRGFYEEKDDLTSSIKDLEKMIQSNSFYYLGANPAKQSALFSIRDKNNALAQAIHEYEQLSISKGQKEELFIKKWMKVFEVGDSFHIELYAGESYEVKIRSNDKDIYLADKGMGSIQAMLMIFRLATIIKKSKNQNHTSTVIIEEPELNLHPALQSKIADLFLEVHKEYGVNFIVETHSEYIIRRSQVIVATENYGGELGENPFSVIYYPKEIANHPYNMKYMVDGTFDKNFGPGFFDEASASTLRLIRMRREKRNND